MDRRLSRERSTSTGPFLCYERKACVTVALRNSLAVTDSRRGAALAHLAHTLGANTDRLLYLAALLLPSSFFFRFCCPS